MDQNIVGEYSVRISPHAYLELNELYEGMAKELLEPLEAESLMVKTETAILSLYTSPYRGRERKIGKYAYKGYRQIFVEDFPIVYRVDEVKKQVLIITVHHKLIGFSTIKKKDL